MKQLFLTMYRSNDALKECKYVIHCMMFSTSELRCIAWVYQHLPKQDCICIFTFPVKRNKGFFMEKS